MASACAVMPEAWSGCAEPLADQRSKGRYPLALELQYKLLRGSRIERVGSGRTLNISSGGVLFKADDPLPARGSVELAMQWPFLLQGACGLKLVMRGRIVRCDANTRATAVRTEYYEFRTAGMRFTNMAATAVVNRKD